MRGTFAPVDEDAQIIMFLWNRYGYWPQGVFQPLVDRLIDFRFPHNEVCLN